LSRHNLSLAEVAATSARDANWRSRLQRSYSDLRLTPLLLNPSWSDTQRSERRRAPCSLVTFTRAAEIGLRKRCRRRTTVEVNNGQHSRRYQVVLGPGTGNRCNFCWNWSDCGCPDCHG
jgi:hypothetical protein